MHTVVVEAHQLLQQQKTQKKPDSAAFAALELTQLLSLTGLLIILIASLSHTVLNEKRTLPHMVCSVAHSTMFVTKPAFYV